MPIKRLEVEGEGKLETCKVITKEGTSKFGHVWELLCVNQYFNNQVPVLESLCPFIYSFIFFLLIVSGLAHLPEQFRSVCSIDAQYLLLISV